MVTYKPSAVSPITNKSISRKRFSDTARLTEQKNPRYGEHPGQELRGRMPTEPFPTSKPVSSSELSKSFVPLDAEYLQLLVWSFGKGTPPELRTLYRLRPKGTQVPNDPLGHRKDPDAQTTWRFQV
ncbi:hypothetical protein Nmel_014095 [Mimus melanotis]